MSFIANGRGGENNVEEDFDSLNIDIFARAVCWGCHCSGRQQ
jgi:hypothetical protein